MVQLAEKYYQTAMIVRQILSTSCHNGLITPNDIACLLSKTGRSDYIEIKTKQTLKRIKSQDSAKSLQRVKTSRQSQSCIKL